MISTRKCPIAVIIVACALSSSAPVHAQVKVDLPTIVIKPCAKRSTTLASGIQKGKLKKERTVIYAGPSVVCDESGYLKSDTSFIVLGAAKSTFGKPWYQVEMLNSGKTAWIPTKYVTLAGKYTRKPKYTIANIADILVFSDIALNVRQCPDVSCSAIAVLVSGARYHATKKSSNGWYFVSIGDKAGWVSGKYVTVEPAAKKEKVEVVETIPPPPKLKPVKKKVDPCELRVDVTDYRTKALWRVEKPLVVHSAPNTNCYPTDKLSIGQGLISLGQSRDFFELAYVTDDDLRTGYFQRGQYVDQYIAMSELPSSFHESQAKSTILNAEQYWDSWGYAITKFIRGIANLYAKHPFTMWLFTLLAALGLLYINPRTRPIVVLSNSVKI